MPDYAQPAKQPDPGGSEQKRRFKPEVEGMSANVTFGSNGIVAITIEVEQTSTFDDSSGYSVTGAIGSASATASRLESMTGLAPFTVGQDFDLSLTFAGTNAATLSGSIPGLSVTSNGTEPIALAGSGQTLDGSVHFGVNGDAQVALDLTSDASITRTSDAFTASGGAANSERNLNVVQLTAAASFTAGTAFTVSVEYLDGTGTTRLYSGTCAASNVVVGRTVNVPMSIQ